MVDSSTEAAATKPIERILDRLTGVEAKNNGYVARCPAHDDQNPSLSIAEGLDGKVLLNCFAGCAFEDIMNKLRLPPKAAFPKQGEGGFFTPSRKRGYVDTGDTEGCTLLAYAEYKGLPVEFLRSVKVNEIANYNGAPAVRMPYLDAPGEERCVRFRVSLKGNSRIKTRKGDKLRLYGLWRLDEARERGYVLIVEGESDAQTGWFHKYPIVGVPGANSWRDEWAEALDRIERLYVVVEDEAGEALWVKLAASPLSERLYRVTLEGAKDLSELHLQDEGRFSERLDEALLKAPSYIDLVAAQTDQIAREAWAKCQDLASEERILDCFETKLAASGVVGNATNCKLIYLALTTRLMDRKLLVNILVKGPSSAGKSYQVEKVLDFSPRTPTFA